MRSLEEITPDCERALVHSCLRHPTESVAKARAVGLLPADIRDPLWRTMFEVITEQVDSGLVREVEGVELPDGQALLREVNQRMAGKLQRHEIENGFRKMLDEPFVQRELTTYNARTMIERSVELEVRQLQEGLASTDLREGSKEHIDLVFERVSEVRKRLRFDDDEEDADVITFQQAIREFQSADPENYRSAPLVPGSVNRSVQGVWPGEVCIVAAPTSHGKSMYALNCIDAALAAGFASMFVSLEMSYSALGSRLNAMFRDNPEGNWTTHYEGKPVALIRRNIVSVDEAIDVMDHAVEKWGIEFFVIDYMQLMSGKGENRTTQLEYISKAIANATTRLECSTMVLAQFNREGRGLDNIKGSSQIGQDADIVLTLEWPAMDNADSGTEEDYTICVVKNRNRYREAKPFHCRALKYRQRIEDYPSTRDPFEGERVKF